MALRPLQRPLFCPCGQAPPAVSGRCRPCYRAAWRSQRYFAGHREQILARDRSCRACGQEKDLCVHHRIPGRHDKLIAVCRACHARLHRRYRPPLFAPALLVHLWEEQHPGWPLQLPLFSSLSVGAELRERTAA